MSESNRKKVSSENAMDANNLLILKNRVAECEEKYNRPSGSIKILASSKSQSIEKMQALYQAGQRCFGENYLQEALIKIETLPKDIEWHFIGTIQRNKTRKIAEHFSWVQSISDPHIAERFNDQRPIHLPPLNICIEINVNHEASKTGIDINAVLPLAKHCLTLPRLRLRGIMAIPEKQTEFSKQRESFHQLYSAYKSLCDHGIPLDTLSMGMSGDFEAAIAEGSTMIRVGRALFGERF